MKSGPSLPRAEAAWEAGHVLRAGRFDDVYYSRAGGVAEKRHVFLRGCGLPDGWRNASHFTIGELGFGTGLNFLCAWELWRRTRAPGTRLHYVAVEGFPLSPGELRDAVAQWHELHDEGAALARAYTEPQRGFHRLFLSVDDAPVALTLLFGEAAAMLGGLEAPVDAWFLDGFAPDRNPEMWREDVLQHVARLSHGGTRLATYSAASTVRRGLEAVGFEVTHAPGFGAKREMLSARFAKSGAADREDVQPWFARAPALPKPRARAAIVGAGIAGTSAAHALRRRGWDVTLIERHGAVGMEASGNPVGVLMPRLTAGDHLEGRFHAAAWRFALNTLEELSDQGRSLERARCGVLQLAGDEADAARLDQIVERGVLPDPYLFGVTAPEASEIAGCRLDRPGMYFSQGGWLSPRLFCAALQAEAPLVHAAVSGIVREGDGWHVMAGATSVATVDIVILANALNATTMDIAPWLPLTARRGQITLLPPTAASASLRTVISAGAYLTPLAHGRHCLGATFDWMKADDVLDVRAEDHARNLADIAAAVPNLLADAKLNEAAGRVGIRCMAPDHLPVVGPIPDHARYLADYAGLRHGQAWVRYPTASYSPGVYVLSALGARGFVTAPLTAEILACHITGEPWPVERDLVTALHPGRFLVRDLKRLKA